MCVPRTCTRLLWALRAYLGLSTLTTSTGSTTQQYEIRFKNKGLVYRSKTYAVVDFDNNSTRIAVPNQSIARSRAELTCWSLLLFSCVFGFLDNELSSFRTYHWTTWTRHDRPCSSARARSVRQPYSQPSILADSASFWKIYSSGFHETQFVPQRGSGTSSSCRMQKPWVDVAPWAKWYVSVSCYRLLPTCTVRAMVLTLLWRRRL